MPKANLCQCVQSLAEFIDNSANRCCVICDDAQIRQGATSQLLRDFKGSIIPAASCEDLWNVLQRYATQCVVHGRIRFGTMVV